jgi:thiamine-phosphate pyrophosphorylase
LRRFLYLISPSTINHHFYKDLEDVLSSRKVKYFQLRLKKYSSSKLLKIAKKAKTITKKYKVKLIINDFPLLAKKINADGCHLGQSDRSIKNTRKLLKKNKIIGITCHGSKKLILNAIKEKPNYIALGSFFKSRLKPRAKRAKKNLVKWSKQRTSLPIVAIGGINNKNYRSLMKFGVNYLAISSYIWNNPRLKPKKAIRKFN